MPVWDVREKDGLPILNARIIPYCSYCQVELELADFKPRGFSMAEKIGRALDMSYLCPQCKSEEMFGIAISKEEYDLFGNMRLI